MKKILTLSVIILLIDCFATSKSSYAEELVSGGGGWVLVFKTEDQLKFATKHIVEGGSNWDPVFMDTIKVMVQDGTKCSVIEKKSGVRKVRILTGPWKGKIGWVHSERVR